MVHAYCLVELCHIALPHGMPDTRLRCMWIFGCTGAAAHGAAAKRKALAAWACSSIPPERRKLQVLGALMRAAPV